MYTEIRYEVNEPAAIITLNRPAALNAWTNAMDGEIQDAMRRAEADRSVVGIIVTGEGRAFCAGADMNMLSSIAGGDQNQASAPERSAASPASADGPNGDGEFSGRFPYLMTIDKPIIAAINGAVAGMAYPFALCCDLRVITPEAVMLTAFAQRGLIAEWGLSWLLPRLVGPGVALDLLFSSRKVSGEEAVRIGLANTMVERDELIPYCIDYIRGLAERCSPTSLAIMKRQVYEQLHVGLGAAERHARQLMIESFGRTDFADGVKSFLEKRPPEFGRLPLPES